VVVVLVELTVVVFAVVVAGPAVVSGNMSLVQER